MSQQQLLSRKHPINAIPFEAFYRGSWHGVSLVSIKNGGRMFIQLKYDGSIIEDTSCGDYIRPRSRKATTIDCFNLLKIGVDVCVRSAHPITESSDQWAEVHLWHDAKIISIKSNHHEDRCTCLFSVAFCKNSAIARTVKSTCVTEVVNIDNLAILQKLHCEPCEDGLHDWTSSEDCLYSSRSKLLSGTISSEVSWLIVLSTLRGMEFNMELVQNKLLYRILNDVQRNSSRTKMQSDGDTDVKSLAADEKIKVIRFQRCNENLRPKIGSFIPENIEEKDVEDRTIDIEENHIDNNVSHDSDVEILCYSTSLRRSKRRKVLPDRFTTSSLPNFGRCSIKKPDDLDGNVMLASSGPSSPREDKLMHKIANSLKHEQYGTTSLRPQTERQLNRKTAKSLSPPPFIIEAEEETCEFPESNLQGGGKLKNSCRRVKKEWKSPGSNSIHHFSSLSNQKIYSNRKKLWSASECEQLIERCMRSTEPEMKIPLQPDIEWESSQAKLLEDMKEFNWNPGDDTQIEVDENEDLWKEMDHSLITLALLEQKQKLEPEIFEEASTTSDEDGKTACQHVWKLNEQIGMTCQLCNFICTEIRDVAPSFFRNDGWRSYKDTLDKYTPQWMKSCNLGSFSDVISPSEMLSEACNNVWTLVPDFKSKLHSHQKRAFEFIWRNIAGSLNPEEMNSPSDITGGCVISHSPGSGKTLLMIAFLLSYLKLFPRSRPLVLAPKIAVCIWCQEFEKWKVPFPVHVIHPVESFRKEMWDSNNELFTPGDRRPSIKMMQKLDWLLKIKQWQEKPSVLLMSYSTFSALTDEKSKDECRKFMADVLLNSPGMLILDEGHNPRSTGCKLRKMLMKVNTEYRILLSGTLFQNNFKEYFNTLYLARPRFADDVIRKLGRSMVSILCDRSQKGDRKKRKEKLARKLFIEEIGQKIKSSAEEERSQGFSLLNKTTSGFINVYEGGIHDGLPGLHVYTLMLTSSDIQWKVLKKLQNSIIQKRCPLEVEILIQVGSMHPWLIKTIGRVDHYFSKDELDKLESYKKKFQSGCKVKFVFDLVQKAIVKGEKVLIFCHNISPINFLVELFEMVFGWYRGEEVLVLQGDQELCERSEIMDKFNKDSGNKCKVLIASTLACAEGISLTAASRVVLLDSEWNHSKTRQAIARAFRPGQERVVYVYRLLALGTWEEDKYHSNEWKAWLSKMIFLGKYFKFSSSRKVDVVEDEILKELVEEDPTKTIQLILKQD